LRDYLESMLDIFTDVQKERLIKNIKSLYANTERTLDVSEYKELIDYINANHHSTLKKTKFKNKIDSIKYNKFAKELETDLKFLYDESNMLETIINNYEVLTDSIVSEIENQIKILELEISKLRYETVNGKAKGLVEVFINASNANDYIVDLNNKDIKKHIDYLLEDPRTNKKIDKIVKIDASSKNISLPINSSVDVVNSNTKIRLVGSTVDFSKAINSDITKAIDKNTTTFFGDVFLCNGELNKPYGVKLDERDSEYYKTFSGGVIYDIELTFDRKYNINEIICEMYEKYPTELLCILYKETTDIAEDYKEYKLNDTLKSELNTIDIKCSPFNAIMIRMIFRQKTYESRSYTMLKDDANNAKIIEKIFEAEKNATLQSINKNLTQEEIDSLTSMVVYKEKLEEFKRKYMEFKNQLKKSGFNWTDEQIKAYIKTGKY